MKTYSQILKEAYEKAEKRLLKRIESKGVKCKHFNEKCLVIMDDNLMFNLEGSRYLTEVKRSASNRIELIDNSGYSYHFSVLSADDFFEVVDHLLAIY